MVTVGPLKNGSERADELVNGQPSERDATECEYLPSEIEFPVESAPRHVGCCDILERFIGNDVDDWTNDDFPNVISSDQD